MIDNFSILITHLALLVVLYRFMTAERGNRRKPYAPPKRSAPDRPLAPAPKAKRGTRRF